MNFFSLATLALVLLFAVAVLGAPSNSSSTDSQGGKRPLPSKPKAAAVSTTKSPSVVSTQRKSNSTAHRQTRDLVKLSSTPANKKANSTGASTPSHPQARDTLKSTPTSTTSPSHKKANSTSHRQVREADVDQVQIPDSDGRSENADSSSPQHFVPSTHPLFANRQSSNITNSLKPKLRSPGSSSGDSSEEDHSSGQSTSGSKKNQNSQNKASSEHSDETVSVVSSGPVAVQGHTSTRNSSRPVSIRRSSTSTTHAPIEDDEVAVFVF